MMANLEFSCGFQVKMFPGNVYNELAPISSYYPELCGLRTDIAGFPHYNREESKERVIS